MVDPEAPEVTINQVVDGIVKLELEVIKKILRIIDDDSTNTEFNRVWKQRYTDLGSDRGICSRLGLDYSTLQTESGEDDGYLKLVLLAYYETRSGYKMPMHVDPLILDQ